MIIPVYPVLINDWVLMWNGGYMSAPESVKLEWVVEYDGHFIYLKTHKDWWWHGMSYGSNGGWRNSPYPETDYE